MKTAKIETAFEMCEELFNTAIEDREIFGIDSIIAKDSTSEWSFAVDMLAKLFGMNSTEFLSKQGDYFYDKKYEHSK